MAMRQSINISMCRPSSDLGILSIVITKPTVMDICHVKMFCALHVKPNSYVKIPRVGVGEKIMYMYF